MTNDASSFKAYYNIRSGQAKTLAVRILQGYKVTKTKCARCGVSILEYQGNASCVVCPTLVDSIAEGEEDGGIEIINTLLSGSMLGSMSSSVYSRQGGRSQSEELDDSHPTSNADAMKSSYSFESKEGYLSDEISVEEPSAAAHTESVAVAETDRREEITTPPANEAKKENFNAAEQAVGNVIQPAAHGGENTSSSVDGSVNAVNQTAAGAPAEEQSVEDSNTSSSVDGSVNAVNQTAAGAPAAEQAVENDIQPAAHGGENTSSSVNGSVNAVNPTTTHETVMRTLAQIYNVNCLCETWNCAHKELLQVEKLLSEIMMKRRGDVGDDDSLLSSLEAVVDANAVTVAKHYEDVLKNINTLFMENIGEMSQMAMKQKEHQALNTHHVSFSLEPPASKSPAHARKKGPAAPMHACENPKTAMKRMSINNIAGDESTKRCYMPAWESKMNSVTKENLEGKMNTIAGTDEELVNSVATTSHQPRDDEFFSELRQKAANKPKVYQSPKCAVDDTDDFTTRNLPASVAGPETFASEHVVEKEFQLHQQRWSSAEEMRKMEDETMEKSMTNYRWNTLTLSEILPADELKELTLQRMREEKVPEPFDETAETPDDDAEKDLSANTEKHLKSTKELLGGSKLHLPNKKTQNRIPSSSDSISDSMKEHSKRVAELEAKTLRKYSIAALTTTNPNPSSASLKSASTTEMDKTQMRRSRIVELEAEAQRKHNEAALAALHARQALEKMMQNRKKNNSDKIKGEKLCRDQAMDHRPYSPSPDPYRKPNKYRGSMTPKTVHEQQHFDFNENQVASRNLESMMLASNQTVQERRRRNQQQPRMVYPGNLVQPLSNNMYYNDQQQMMNRLHHDRMINQQQPRMEFSGNYIAPEQMVHPQRPRFGHIPVAHFDPAMQTSHLNSPKVRLAHPYETQFDREANVQYVNPNVYMQDSRNDYPSMTYDGTAMRW